MEVHHHPHAEKKGFKEYFLEFLMIFLAVTLGFFAENIREYIADHHKELQYIKSLSADMKEDSSNLELNINWTKLAIKALDSMIILIQKPSRDSSETNYLYLIARYSTRSAFFDPTDRTISQLNNSGNFRLIRSESLADSIIEYWHLCTTYKNNYTVSLQEKENLYPFISAIFDANVFQTMVDSTNIIHRPTGYQKINTSDIKMCNQFIYYIHQVKSTIIAENLNLKNLLLKNNSIRKIIKEQYTL